MPRFFVSKDSVAGGEAIVTGPDARHIARSLRMAVGEKITVCDGSGREFVCRLESIRDDLVTAAILSSSPCGSEPPYRATVYQALVKGDRSDTVITKSVEFGASEIVFFESSRCIVRSRDESENKSQRRSRLASEAAMQCGRGRIPSVGGPLGFGEMLDCARGADIALFCYENEKGTLLPAALPASCPATVAIVIGPEGGFSAEEAEQAAELGLIPVGLGERILRTESAAPFVLAVLSGRYELAAGGRAD